MNPDSGYIFYIVNPKSGASSGKLMVTRFRQYLCDKGFDVRCSFTQSLEHAGDLATRASMDYDCALVAAAGGDGTIREVAHGLEGSGKTLLITPCGTENLLANELGFDEKVQTVIKAFESQTTRNLDLGRVNGKCFTSIAGFGFDGEVVRQFTEKRLGHISHLDYFWPIWRTFWCHKFPAVKVAMDGQELFEGQGLVFVGNISRYAMGLQILRYADYGDGMLDVCIYKCASQVCLMKHSLNTLFKTNADKPDVIYRQGRNISISSVSKDLRTQIDGDPGPSLPVTIEVIPQAVKVLVPPNAKPAGIRTRLVRMLG